MIAKEKNIKKLSQKVLQSNRLLRQSPYINIVESIIVRLSYHWNGRYHNQHHRRPDELHGLHGVSMVQRGSRPDKVFPVFFCLHQRGFRPVHHNGRTRLSDRRVMSGAEKLPHARFGKRVYNNRSGHALRRCALTREDTR